PREMFYARRQVLFDRLPRVPLCRLCRDILAKPYTRIPASQLAHGIAYVKQLLHITVKRTVKTSPAILPSRPRLAKCRRCKQKFPRNHFAIYTKHNKVCLDCDTPVPALTPEEKRQKRRAQRIKAQKNYLANHPEKAKQICRTWRDNNRKLIKIYNRRRKASKHNPHFIEDVDINIIRARDK